MEKTLKELLHEQLEIKGVSLQRLHQLTNIPERYITGIFEMDPRNIPAFPYIRGYLLKIGDVLNLNGEELWQKYKKEVEVKSSGSEDRLPENRYTIKKINKRWLTLVLLGVAIISYTVFNASRIIGQPLLTINSPTADTDLTASAIYNFSGKIDPNDTLKINNEQIVVGEKGEFTKFYNLQSGLNTFEFSVKRFLGKEVKVVKQIIYQTQAE